PPATPRSPIQPAPSLRAELERFARAAARAAASIPFDAIHAHDWPTVPAALRIARASGRPFLFHVHSTEFDRNPCAPDPELVELEARALRSADHVVTVSRRSADELLARYDLDPAKLTVIHNGVESLRAASTSGPRPLRATSPIVLFLARLTEQKDPATFLEAAALVHGTRPDVRFIVAGDGPLREEMEHLSEELGLQRTVHFTGHLCAADADRAFAVADLYVLPSAAEPFGISALEAMCQDTPALVSRGSGVTEVLPEALTFDPGSSEDLANRILSILSRPELHRDLSERGGRRARTLRWHVRAQSLLALLEDLVP
ncbi:MAG TPA: glycosyltransferase family 1 protein, partial [Planctomycetes bacterium]|nr:glycosyltransferase family 1 protein [Planctomycetota bacterium]